jgi:hypothetical protein
VNHVVDRWSAIVMLGNPPDGRLLTAHYGAYVRAELHR